MSIFITWAIISAVLFIGEIITTGFVLLWFAIGALIAMILSVFVDNLIIQFSVFVVVSTVLFLFTKPLTDRFFKSTSKFQSNVHSMVGQKARVIEEINFKENTGKVKVNGEVWRALLEDEGESSIAIGEDVTIKSVASTKVIVTK